MTRVVWAMQEPTGEFGEVVRGTEGVVVGDGDSDGVVLVEWDSGVLVAVEMWMTDLVSA